MPPAQARTALVTGATSGIGAEFARQLAERGYDLVIVARTAERLEQTRADLAGRFGVAVEVIAADLATDAGCAAVASRLGEADRPVEVLVNNAGSGMYQRFGDGLLADEERQLDLNVRAVLRLTYAALGPMRTTGRGHVINVSSVAGFVPRGSNATYSASKAWVTMFSEGLAVQLHDTGVVVTAVCPGFTHTEFHQRANADMSHVPARMWLNATDVVRDGLADAFAGRPVSVSGRQYRAAVVGSRLIPRPVLHRIMIRRGF